MPMNREIELKGSIRSEHLDQIKTLPAIRKYAVGRARSRKLVTIYFDTPDHALRNQGLSLRVRKVGSAYIQCVKKVDTTRLGGVLVRKEWEGPVPDQTPAISVIENKSLRRQIKRAGVDRLIPLFRTDFQRSSRKLKFDDNSTVTFDIDAGKIITENGSNTICEFELELDEGTPDRLFDLASEIRETVPFRLASISKASRGYALLTTDGPRARKYISLDLAKDTTVEQALTRLIQHCLDQLQANEAIVLTTDDPEGVHQMRAALRRLRAALRLFKSALPEEQYNWAVNEAIWLADELSPARAWDVFADELVTPVTQLDNLDEGFDAFLSAVEQERQQGRQQARDAINADRYTDFLLRLSAWLSGQAWRDQPVSEQTALLLDPVRDYCGKLLQKRDQAVREQGQEIENMSEAARHEMRLAVKTLRYTLDFFESFYPKKRVRAYRKYVDKLQDRLGYLNDVAMSDTLVTKLKNRNKSEMDEGLAYGCGLTIGWHRRAAMTAERKLVKDVKAFLRTEPFW